MKTARLFLQTKGEMIMDIVEGALREACMEREG
jgi:hypothetical protein